MPLVTPRILVVDDNEVMLTIFGMLLADWGFDFRTAGSGFTALDVARAFNPHVVISDICMPDMDGLDLARRVRLSLGPSVYLIALTADDRPQVREGAQVAGFNAFKVKPVDYDELRELIESVVKSQQNGD